MVTAERALPVVPTAPVITAPTLPVVPTAPVITAPTLPAAPILPAAPVEAAMPPPPQPTLPAAPTSSAAPVEAVVPPSPQPATQGVHSTAAAGACDHATDDSSVAHPDFGFLLLVCNPQTSTYAGNADFWVSSSRKFADGKGGLRTAFTFRNQAGDEMSGTCSSKTGAALISRAPPGATFLGSKLNHSFWLSDGAGGDIVRTSDDAIAAPDRGYVACPIYLLSMMIASMAVLVMFLLSGVQPVTAVALPSWPEPGTLITAGARALAGHTTLLSLLSAMHTSSAACLGLAFTCALPVISFAFHLATSVLYSILTYFLWLCSYTTSALVIV